MSAPSAAAMLALIDQAIADRLTGGAVQSVTIGGFSAANYSLDQLRALRRDYAAMAAAAASDTGSLQFTKITNQAPSA